MGKGFDNTVFGVSTCPQTNNGWKKHWENFPYEFHWMWDNNNGKGGEGLVYTEEEMCKELGFSGEVSKKHYWNSFGNRNIIWFYAHFRMLYFYKKNPNYDWYYFFDDDVTCNNWEELLQGFSESKSDFLAWYVFSKEKYKEHIPDLDKDTTSKHMWFERFPGDGDSLPWWVQQYYGSFFPVVRFSNTAMNTLLQQFQWGVWGYSEGFVPTILNGYNHSLETIFQKDGTSKLYDIDKVNLQHKWQKIGWDWI